MNNIETIRRLALLLEGALRGITITGGDNLGNELLLTTRELLGKVVEAVSNPSAEVVFDENYEAPAMSNFQRTANWLSKCGKVVGIKHASVQYGAHLEEFAEQLDCVTIISMTGVDAVVANEISRLTKHLAQSLKTGVCHMHVYESARPDFLDACSDLEVTNNGTAFLMGMDKESHDAQVLFKNDDKLENGEPVILPGGKIGKRAGWTPPDPTPFAGAELPPDLPARISLDGASLEEATEFVAQFFQSVDRKILSEALQPVLERVAAEASGTEEKDAAS